MLTDKEKLEEELKLLEESLHLEVITKEEYEQTKQRIEEKLKSLEQKETMEISEAKEPVEEEPVEEKQESMEVKEEKVEIKEVKEEEVEEIPETKEKPEEETEKKVDVGKSKISSTDSVGEEKPAEEKKEAVSEKEEAVEESEKVKSAEEIAAEQVKEAAEEAEAKEETGEEKKEPEEKKEEVAETPKAEEKEEEKLDFQISKGSVKIFMYVIVILLLAFGSYFFFFSGNQEATDELSENLELSEKTVFIACNSDEDCKREGSVGTCNNPGTADAECTYVEDVEVKLTVLNDNGCFNCDTGRVLSILNGFFPNLEIENLDIETSEGNETADEFDVNVLPTYILNSSLQQTNNYPRFSNAFNKVGGSFVMKNTVSNANYYIERVEIPGKLDLIFKANQVASLEAERNLRGFLDAFDGKVDFEKHGESSALAKELGINTFPVFLVNNKIKFSGVQAADVIKENFCQMNEPDGCSLDLTKSLV